MRVVSFLVVSFLSFLFFFACVIFMAYRKGIAIGWLEENCNRCEKCKFYQEMREEKPDCRENIFARSMSDKDCSF